MSILSLLTPLIAPVAKIFEKREDRKNATIAIKGKIAAAEMSGTQSVKLSKAEWELAGQKLQGETWKDEFITIVVFSPFVTALVGAVLSVFGMPR